MSKIKKLIEEMPVSKEKLYEKYNKYQDWNKSMKNNEVLVASKVFDIDFGNKPALFFLIVGMMTIENEVKVLIGRN